MVREAPGSYAFTHSRIRLIKSANPASTLVKGSPCEGQMNCGSSSRMRCNEQVAKSTPSVLI